ALVAAFLAQDGDARLEVGWLDECRETPLKARDQAFTHLQVSRLPIAGEHHLLAERIEGVERMEKNVLRLLLSLEELYVVNEQEVGTAVQVRELVDAIVLDRLHEVGREFIARNVQYTLGFSGFHQCVADCIHEMS